jgi:hypothetical protein
MWTAQVTMDPVQEMIDEHKHEMSTALAKKLLDACKAVAEERPKLYRVTVTRVATVAWIKEGGENDCDEPEVKMQHRTQTLLLEASLLDVGPDVRKMDGRAIDMMDRGQLWCGWLELTLPCTMARGDDELTIVHSITPYVHKRSRE